MTSSEQACARHKGCGGGKIILALLKPQSRGEKDIETATLKHNLCDESCGRAGRASWRKRYLG